MNAPADARFRRIAAAVLFGAHAGAYGILSALGLHDPIELFTLLLLLAQGVLGMLLWRGRVDGLIGGGVMFLIAAHAFLGRRLAPDPLTSGAILMVNILVVYVGVQVNRRLPTRHWVAFVASYFALFLLFVEIRLPWWPEPLQRLALSNAEPLFILFLLGLTACARSLRLLAYFWALTLSFTLLQPYAWESLFLLWFLLTAFFGARGRLPSPAARVFLGAGMLLGLLVLLPVVLVVFGVDLHNVERVLRDERIRDAIGLTVLTATIATGCIALFGVPLAYALARLRFPGRALLLALIDLPIVIPQSAAGIAIVLVLGRQQPIGGLVHRVFGVPVDGTLLGIVAAQVFVAMPFLVKSALAAFRSVDEELELAARTLGASSWGAFGRVALPLATQGIVLGAILAWARAAGEFGAIILIAPTPETAPVAAFNRFNAVGLVETAPLVATLLLFSAGMFLLLQWAGRLLPGAHVDAEDRG